MELFSVKLSYTMPASAHREAEYKEASTAVAVAGSFGPDLIRRAGVVATRAVVGVSEPEDLERWQVFISAINYLGSVHVEQETVLTAEPKEEETT